MRFLSEIKELEIKKRLKIIDTSFDGGCGVFLKGSLKGMTVTWSFAGGWEHVSVDGKTRTPTWEEMCQVKDMFFEKDECCIQYFPAEEDYVNIAKYCLHIWKPIEKFAGPLPKPPKIFV